MSAFTDACQPSGCGCLGHHVPGVEHLIPCCDQPHVEERDYPAIVTEYVMKAQQELAERLAASGRVAVSDPYWTTDPDGSMRLTVDTMPAETGESDE